MTDDFPRRVRVDKMVLAERRILEAQRAVEEMPADVRLTEAGELLTKARELVADFVDAQPTINKAF